MLSDPEHEATARIAALQDEYKASIRLYEEHASMFESLKRIEHGGLQSELESLARAADTGWDSWDRTTRWLAAEKFRLIWGIETRRHEEAERAAGRDPYATDPPAPDPEKFGTLIAGLAIIKTYAPRHPLVIDRDIGNVRQ